MNTNSKQSLENANTATNLSPRQPNTQLNNLDMPDESAFDSSITRDKCAVVDSLQSVYCALSIKTTTLFESEFENDKADVNSRPTLTNLEDTN